MRKKERTKKGKERNSTTTITAADSLAAAVAGTAAILDEHDDLCISEVSQSVRCKLSHILGSQNIIFRSHQAKKATACKFVCVCVQVYTALLGYDIKGKTVDVCGSICSRKCYQQTTSTPLKGQLNTVCMPAPYLA